MAGNGVLGQKYSEWWLFDNTTDKVERRIEQPIMAYTTVVSVF